MRIRAVLGRDGDGPQCKPQSANHVDGFDYQRRLTARSDLGCQSVGTIFTCQRYDAGLARWFGLEERLTLNWLRDQTLVTQLGVEVRERQVGAKQDNLNAATGRTTSPSTGLLDERGASVGPYIQQTWTPAGWLDLNAGARLDIDERFDPVLSPRGAILLRPFEKTTFKAIYSQAFRAPTWSETSIASHTVAPAPDLSPERVRSIEGVIEQGLGAQKLRLGVFATKWTDLVETSVITPEELMRLQASGDFPGVVLNAVQSRNVASIDNYGVSGSWRGSSLNNRMQYGANLTWAYARIRAGQTSSRLAAAPEILGNAHLTYSLGSGWPDIAFVVRAMGTRPADDRSPTGEKLPAAPAFADLHLALSGRVPGLDALGYLLSADYITANHGPYTAGPDYSAIPTVWSMISALPEPGFAPVDQLRIMLGLRVDLFMGRTASAAEAP